jgi:hypothetical protein
MMTQPLWALQSAAEYGAMTGGRAGGATWEQGLAGLTAWATEHQVTLLAAGAALLLLWMLRGALRR